MAEIMLHDMYSGLQRLRCWFYNDYIVIRNISHFSIPHELYTQIRANLTEIFPNVYKCY